MDKMAAESLLKGMSAGFFNEIQLKNYGSLPNYPRIRSSDNNCSWRTIRASQEPLDENKNKFYKELGMFSLRKRIEDSVLRAEMLAPSALQLEKAKHVDRHEGIREYDLWDDLNKSNEMLIELADSAKVVDTLRDLKFKAEEAKLITELAEMDSINYSLFKQAYSASLDVNKFLDKYEMSKLLKDPYDREGACIVLESRRGDTYAERWLGQLTQMYMKWAERQGQTTRTVEKFHSNGGGLKSATIELEFKYAYGYLSGEKGLHCMVRNPDNGFNNLEVDVDVIPLFMESSPELVIDDEDVQVSYPSYYEGNQRKNSTAVHILHIPTGFEFQSTGERSRFANKIKALNRLKAKLLIILRDQQISSIEKADITDESSREIRKYVFGKNKKVQDLKAGVQIPDLNAVLNGNLDPLIAAHIHSRQTCSAK